MERNKNEKVFIKLKKTDYIFDGRTYDFKLTTENSVLIDTLI